MQEDRACAAQGWKSALLLPAAAVALFAQSPAEDLIEAGHWKRARALVEARMREAPNDPLAIYLTSQIRFAFGDANTPLKLAEKALALDGGAATYHRQIAEVTGVMAQHANVFQQLLLARRFQKEICVAITLDPKDIQSLRDLMEFYLLALARKNEPRIRSWVNDYDRACRLRPLSKEGRPLQWSHERCGTCRIAQAPQDRECGLRQNRFVDGN